MSKFQVPTRDEVSENNQAIFDNLQKGLGFVPNLYAYYAKSETALADYLALQNRKSTLKAKEREVINLRQQIEEMRVKLLRMPFLRQATQKLT